MLGEGTRCGDAAKDQGKEGVEAVGERGNRWATAGARDRERPCARGLSQGAHHIPSSWTARSPTGCNCWTSPLSPHVAMSQPSPCPLFPLLFPCCHCLTATLPLLLPPPPTLPSPAVTEATFNWTGFLSAIFSNMTFQSRNVLSKKLMIKKGAVDNMNLFQIITIMSFLMLLPVSTMVEGGAALLTPESLANLVRAAGAGVVWVVWMGVCRGWGSRLRCLGREVESA